MLVVRLGLAVALAAVWIAAALVWRSHTAARDEEVLAGTLAAVRAVVDSAQGDMRREAALLAEDPAVREGALRSDWATLARGASPRMAALTLQRVADLLVVLDAAGAPLVQVPATPRVPLPALPRSAEPVARLGVVGDRVYVLGWAPLPVGAVVVGRRFESLVGPLAGLPSRPALVVLAGDRALAGSLPGLPATGWEAATRARMVSLAGETWHAHALDAAGGLWALVPDHGRMAAARRFWFWWAVSLSAASGGVLASALLAPRRRPRGARPAGDERRGKQLEALYAVAQTMGTGEDLAVTAERTLDVVCSFARIEFGGVFRFDEAAQTLALIAHRGLSPEDVERLRVRRLDQSHVGEAMRTGRYVVTDLTRSRVLTPEVREQVRVGGYRSQLALPITADGRIWGVMALISREPRAWPEDELTLLQAVAHQVGLAVSRAALFAEAREKSRRLETLTRLAQTLTATLSVDEVFRGVVDAGVELFGSSVARLWLVDDDGEHASLCAEAGATSAVEGIRRFRLGEGLVGAAMARRSPVTVTDVLRDPRTRNAERIRAEGTVSVAIVPLLLGDRVLGALSIGVREPHGYTAEELSVLGSLALHAANAIHNARLFTEERTRRAYLAALLEINTKIGSLAPTDALLSSIAEEAARLLGVDDAGFRLVEGDELVLAGLAGTARETMVRPRLKIGESLSGRVVASGRTLVCELDSVPDIAPEALGADRRLGYTMFLGVPLRVGERTIGVLTFRAPRPFTRHDQELAEAFAGQAAIALEHARLYREAGRQVERMTALAGLGRLLSETLDFDRAAQRVADSVCELLGARSSCLYRLDAATGALVAVTVSSGASFPWTDVLPPGTGIAGLAVRERVPVASDDALADPRITYTDAVRARVAREPHRALLAVPLLVQDRLLGALAVSDRAGRHFDDQEIGLARAFGDQAALALENARLFSLETARREQIATLVEIERELAAELDPDRLLSLIVERVTRLFAANGVIYLVEDGRTLVPRAWTDGGAIPGVAVEIGQGLVGAAAERRRGLVVNDYAGSAFALPRWAELGVRRAIGQPLVIQDRLLGVIGLNRVGDDAAPFLPEDLVVLESFAARAAIALENARLYREAREHAERLAALEEVNRLVSSSLKTEEVLHNIAAAAARFFGAEFVSVWVLDEGSRRLTRSLTFGPPEAAVVLPHALALGEGAIGWVALHREPLPWTDVETDARVVDGSRLAGQGLRFITAYPIAIGDRVLGAFAVYRPTPTPVTPETASLLGSLAAQAAVALDNARLYTETQRRLEETRALLEVVEILNSTLDSKQLLKRAAMKIAQVCRVDRCSLELWEGGQVTPLMSQFADGRKAPEQWAAFKAVAARPILDIPANALARKTRRPVIVNDTARDTLMPQEWIETFGLKSYLVVPMLRQEQVIGVMTLDYCERPTPFEPRQVDLAMTIAGELALALENTRLYAEAQERLRETATLLAVGEILSRPGPVPERVREVAREVARATGANTVGAYFLDAKRESLVPLVGYHVPRELLEGFMTRPIVLARNPELLPAWEAGRATWTSDARADRRFDQDWIGTLPPLSVLFAAATAHGEPIGALFVVWWRPGHEFRPAEIRLVEGVAAQVGLAMENAELARQTQAKLRETETLLSVSRALSSTLNREALLRHFLRRVTAAMDADSAGVWMLADDEETLEPVAGYHLPREFLESLRGMRPSILEHPLWAEAVRTKRPVFSTDVAADARIPDFAKKPFPHRCQLFVPIVAREQVIGGLSLIWWQRAHDFSDGEIALMEAIANQASVAIENARLFEENRRQVEELSVLHDLSRAVTGELDRAALLDALYAQVARMLDVRNMVVVLHDAERHELEIALRIVDGVADARAPLRYPDRTVGLMSLVLTTGRALRTDDYARECARHGVEPIRTSAELRHWLGVPMLAGDVPIGVVALRGGARAFSEDDERVLTNIAQLAALALRSARLFEERAHAYVELATAQDQLVRTEKLRALGEMASGVAHDFNNMLASILGRAQLTLQKVENPQLRQWLQVIERAALDGAATVRRLQEFTRIRRDQPFVAVDLNQVVRDALEITQSRWREEPVSRGVTVEVRTTFGEPPRLAGDPAELREALTNLILNALDAMPEGGVLTLTTAEEAGAAVVIVSDTGVGIPDAVLTKIFDPFFTTKGPQGTGLGLSMTYGIVERHGARINVESAEGRGTTFRLTFPAGPPAEPPAPAAAEPAGTDASLRCLVVDDEPAVGAMLRDVLESGGHRAAVVADGAEAIARFGAEPFDVVFTDLAMPRVSGWQVARAIKEMAPTVPVFLVTGFGVELSEEERRAHGVDLVLVKPIEIHKILDVVAQAARRRARSTRTEDQR